jgi:hypothetical protein
MAVRAPGRIVVPARQSAYQEFRRAPHRGVKADLPYLVALVRAGAVFVNGKLVERPGEDTPPEAA